MSSAATAPPPPQEGRYPSLDALRAAHAALLRENKAGVNAEPQNLQGVLDFLEVHIIVGSWNYHWPDFNVADSAIVVGGFLLFLDALRTSREASA